MSMRQPYGWCPGALHQKRVVPVARHLTHTRKAARSAAKKWQCVIVSVVSQGEYSCLLRGHGRVVCHHRGIGCPPGGSSHSLSFVTALVGPACVVVDARTNELESCRGRVAVREYTSLLERLVHAVTTEPDSTIVLAEASAPLRLGSDDSLMKKRGRLARMC